MEFVVIGFDFSVLVDPAGAVEEFWPSPSKEEGAENGTWIPTFMLNLTPWRPFEVLGRMGWLSCAGRGRLIPMGRRRCTIVRI
jgi:hypothetical protein